MSASASSAAGGKFQKNLLSIIRELAAEMSHGERAVSGLKRRLDDVVAAADAAKLEGAKRVQETELFMTPPQASVAAATSQEEATGAQVDPKCKEDSEIDQFSTQLIEMNASIRKFQQLASVELAEKCFGLSADGYNMSDKDETVNFEGMLTDQADKVGNVDAETCLNEMCQKDKPDHKKVGCRRTKMSTITETVERPKAAGRPMTQYFLFLQDFRKDQKKQPTVEISKAAAEKWKSMTNSEKAPYKSRYDELLRARRNPEPAAPVIQLSSDLEAEPMHVPEHVQAAAPLVLLSSDSEDVQEQAYGHPESASSSRLSGPEPSSCESVKSKYYL